MIIDENGKPLPLPQGKKSRRVKSPRGGPGRGYRKSTSRSAGSLGSRR